MAIHTKKLTKQIIDWLEDEEFEAVDVSYGNDLCDSLLVNGYHIMLPNSFIDCPDRELFTSFQVKKEGGEVGVETCDFYEVLEIIKNKSL